VRIWHLLTHTAGLSYGFHRAHPVDAIYRAAGFDLGKRVTMDLAAACDTWAGIPLLFQPGAEWTYSVATDVLGRVVEAASGQRLDDFFAERILGPLGMTDTAFYARPDLLPRLSALYARGRDGRYTREGAMAPRCARTCSTRPGSSQRCSAAGAGWSARPPTMAGSC
jgi:CubicO group peptidase (beta-lactamase class C family)